MKSAPAPTVDSVGASVPIPQTTIHAMRVIVDAVSRGARSAIQLRKAARFSVRRTAYAVAGAKLLGLVADEGDRVVLTESGKALARTARQSEDEAELLSRAIEGSNLLALLAPGLVGARPPAARDVAEKMQSVGGLSENTALHRAQMLLKWRSVLVNRRMEFSRRSPRNERNIHMPTLEVRDFAQIRNASIAFGDLTVLVGPQATGKSLVLQWFKAALDIAEIHTALKEAGADVRDRENVIDLIFGEGMRTAWHANSEVTFESRSVSPATWTKGLKKTDRGRVFFIPAHRALLLAEGWPAPFIKLTADTPVVARLFSQNLYQRFSGRQAAALFPVTRILKEEYRSQIDTAIFHGGRVELKRDRLRYRLALTYQDASLPFMTWTAGQREFTPLLLGLYEVLPPRKVKKLRNVDWIVIEEPEIGLHPQAIVVFMLLVLDLLWRGYRVVISTHSPVILDVLWATRRLSERPSNWRLLSEAFGVTDSRSVKDVMQTALKKEYRVYFLHYEDGAVISKDISGLDPGSPDTAEAEWGGLSGFSSRFGDAVRRAAIESEETGG